MVPSAIRHDTECELLDLNDKLDLMPQFQHLLDEERDVLPQHHKPLPSTSDNLIVLRAKDKQMDQQQWNLLCTFPDTVVTSQELQEGPRASPKEVKKSQRAPTVEDTVKESDDIPSLKPPPTPVVAETICLMVEDPYFDTPMSSPSEEVPMDSTEDTEQWTVSPIFSVPALSLNDHNVTSPVSAHSDEEAPPPLPERTPESYEMALDAEPSDPCETLSLIIPPNAAAEAVRELR
ncbi:uncharacterized protein LOC111655179, partial [Seriola lalandi dorsalis]